ncbi:SGNH hydrolase domain-containing protein [Devosia salina]|uniref:SGNH domain-containing protein n=1 Tax=Devosia salina TaxID=2860336 RepID=A0ABX8WGI3_9HYPH|nr:SGNH hydrolase domain-containing protein [Devosia salina]QYO77787.1 hypothetical protein K1X15_04250 [Devosia salina]
MRRPRHRAPTTFCRPCSRSRRRRQWPADDCQGRDKVALLAEPFEHCLLPARSADRPNALFLIGDSHAAQLLPMVQAATEGLPFQVRFINPENYEDFPVGFFHQSSASPLLDFIIEHARPGDVLTIAFHRGHLNAERDRHIPVSEPFAINDVSQTFIERTKPFLERFAGKGGRVVLIADTPLMGAVATSSACALQIRLFGSSVCRIERQQDEWTRGQQDAVFMALVADDPDRITIWDPLPAIYGDEDWLDVLDDRGTYLMWDWNHISEPLARKLSEPFQALLENELAPAN